MKKYYFFILFFALFSIGNTFSQNQSHIDKAKNSSEDKVLVDLMVLDSVVSAYAPHEPTILKYDNRGNLISILDHFHKIENTYSSNDLLIKSLFYIWDYDSVSYRTHELSEYTYDNNNNVIQEIFSMFLDGVWKQEQKTISQYNNNLLILQNNYQFDEDSNNWINSRKSEYFYNTNNDITSIKNYNFFNKNFVLSGQTINLYDANNNLINHMQESFNDTLALVWGIKSINAYNANNLMIESISEDYSMYSGSVWKPSFKQEYSYYSNDLLESTENFRYNSSNAWVLHRIDSLNYDSELNPINISSYINYNEAWACNQIMTNVFDYNYTRKDILFQKQGPNYSNNMYYNDFNNMLIRVINSNNNQPDQAGSWSHDTTKYYYSSKTIYFYLPENILFDGSKFMVYPNPAVSEAMINVSGINQEAEISIMDINGKIIKTIRNKPIDNNLNLSIDLSNLNKGIYLINIRSGKYSQTKKLIVN